MLVLDEADEIYSRGFEEQINDITITLPSGIQMVVFLTTLPPELNKITAKVMKDPVKILLKKTNNLSLSPIRQFYVNVEREVID